MLTLLLIELRHNTKTPDPWAMIFTCTVLVEPSLSLLTMYLQYVVCLLDAKLSKAGYFSINNAYSLYSTNLINASISVWRRHLINGLWR